jgi:enolase
MSRPSSAVAGVHARQIFDSRGRPTIEVDVSLADGRSGRACAPSGASTGRHEAVELRDGDKSQFDGLGVSKAVANVNTEIAAAVVGLDSLGQAEIDAKLVALDGTGNFSRLGGNATLATSLAVCRAAATYVGKPLHRYINSLVPHREMSMPMPMTNILSGGAHANRGMDIQDFLAIPVGAGNYTEALTMVGRARTVASQLAAARGITTLLADEGGLSPGFSDAREALDLMIETFKVAGYEPGAKMVIALDVAASELYQGNGSYRLGRQDRVLSGREMAEYVAALVRDYPIASVEDGLDQDDWAHWRRLSDLIPNCQVVGDDLFVTDEGRISRGAAEGAANAALIKVNQNGTLSGTFKAMEAAWSAGFATVVSARSGETDDSFIADLAVGTGAGQIKIGSTRNSERMSKYNQLLRIEGSESLPFAGRQVLAGAPVLVNA